MVHLRATVDMYSFTQKYPSVKKSISAYSDYTRGTLYLQGYAVSTSDSTYIIH